MRFWAQLVGYLFGESDEDDLLKDQQMMQALKELLEFSSQVFFNLDAVIREIENQRMYAEAK